MRGADRPILSEVRAAERSAGDEPLRAPSGTHDILPPESAVFEGVVARFASRARLAGYGLALTPLFEELAVFSRGVGSSTDVVTKEMYDFVDKGGRHLALRPEVTASVARAYVQHRPTLPWRVWYWGPQFRYERPQAGRYRQFWQLGAEVLGTGDPDLDVEVIELAWTFCEGERIPGLSLALNSLGDGACRPAYRERLLAFLEPLAAQLCPEHQTRYRDNPLRVLDCKRPACRDATAAAPTPLEALCPSCRTHFARVQEGLASLGIPAVVTPRLVRGLDYYTRTTFEITASSLSASQDAVGGGGRYDGLVAALGGPETPGIGFSLGLDRLLLARGDDAPAPEAGLEAFVVDLTGGGAALVLTSRLRRAGVAVERAFDSRSLRAQLRMADRSGAAVALIIGPAERAAGEVRLHPLRGGEESVVAIEEVEGALRALDGAGERPRRTGNEEQA